MNQDDRREAYNQMARRWNRMGWLGRLRLVHSCEDYSTVYTWVEGMNVLCDEDFDEDVVYISNRG